MSVDRRRPGGSGGPGDARDRGATEATDIADVVEATADGNEIDERPRAGADLLPPVAESLALTPAAEVGRAALNRAKAAAVARGIRPGTPSRRLGALPPTEHRSGPGRDGRDPALIGDTLARLATERGWSTELSVGGVIGRWRAVVGDQVADHCTPETFEDGLLMVRTDSTAWAANLRLLVPQLLVRLVEEVGPDVVREVKVLGPTGPGWVKGPRRVAGRGPRDTYG